MDRKRRTAQSPQDAASIVNDRDAERARSPDEKCRTDRGEIIEIQTGDVHPSGGPDFGGGPSHSG